MSAAHAGNPLVEDSHQGVTSSKAQRTIDRYRAFVMERRAPIASMAYSPFTKSDRDSQRISAPIDTTPIVALDHVIPASVRQISPRQSALVSEPLLQEKTGGAAWSLDLLSLGFAKPDASSANGSKRNSLIGQRFASRKSSFNFGDSGKRSNRGSVNAGETAQQIWAAHGIADSARYVHQSLQRHAKESSLLASKEGAAQQESSERLSLSSKRNSLKQPYLKAHSTEQRFGVTEHSRPLHAAPIMSKTKRASMPPMHNKRALGFASDRHNATSRRGSVSNVQQVRTAKDLGAHRSRSQSLPASSLLAAYSACSLPAVMTSSLAAMPVPAHPSIPVAVARRYSILSGADSLLPTNTESLLSARSTGSLASEDAEEVNELPENVEGIDVSSVLDTSHLQPLDSELLDDSEAPIEAANESLTFEGLEGGELKTLPSTGSADPTPASSPVGSDANFTHLFPIASPLRQLSDRSRSLIHTQQRNGLTISAPARDQLSTPDYTPLTSPTNLSNAVFKHTLITRRMSDVVAKDISQKLRMLQKHMGNETQQAQA